MQQTYKYTYIQHLLWLLLLGLSMYYFKARICFSDNAPYFFNLLSSGNFNIQHERYIAALTQFLPLLGMKIGASLQTLMICYSANVLLYYYAYFLTFKYLFRQEKMAWLVLCSTLLCSVQGFYWMVSEMALVIPYALLIYTLAEQYRLLQVRAWLYYPFLGLLTYLTRYVHPSATLIVLCIAAFHVCVHYESWRKIYLQPMLIVVFLGVGLLIAKQLGIGVTTIESAEIENIQKNMDLPWTYTLFFEYFIQKYCLYFALPLWFGLGAYALLRMRRLLAILVACGSAIIFFTILYFRLTSFFAQCYAEIYLGGASIFILLMLWEGLSYYSEITQNRIKLALLTLMIINVLQIALPNIYNRRIPYLETRIQAQRTQGVYKVILPNEETNNFYHPDMFGITWTAAYETLLLSSIDTRGSVCMNIYELGTVIPPQPLQDPNVIYFIHWMPCPTELSLKPYVHFPVSQTTKNLSGH